VNCVELIERARQAQLKSYSPYSRFKVGAALLSLNGRIFTAANVENSSYGLTVCAERIAVFKAVTEGERNFQGIAIVGAGRGYTYPCGACLQVLAEFSNNMEVIVADENNNYRRYDLKDLLPHTFDLQK
jgi:cytidine deaminase